MMYPQRCMAEKWWRWLAEAAWVKTTLIKAIARLIKRSGDVALYDDKGNLFSDRDIAYVPQLESVTSRLTAFEMVLLGLVKDLSDGK